MVKLARRPARSHREQTLSCGEGLPIRRQASWKRLTGGGGRGRGCPGRLGITTLSNPCCGSRTGVGGRVRVHNGGLRARLGAGMGSSDCTPSGVGGLKRVR